MATAIGQEFDYLLVGGGLGNALIALALFEARPGLRVGLVEQRGALGGNHVWCFHAGDVDGATQPFVSRLVSKRWPSYEVRFPELARTLAEPYAAVRSERLNQVVQEAFIGRAGSRLFLDARAVRVTDRSVTLETGQELHARTVIESRGPEALSTGPTARSHSLSRASCTMVRPRTPSWSSLTSVP